MRGRRTQSAGQRAKINGAKKSNRLPNDRAQGEDARDPVLARLLELHGRAAEVARRVLNDARILEELQGDTSALLGELWSRQAEPLIHLKLPADLTPRTADDPRSPRFLRFKEVARRVGLSRSSVWRMERNGHFPHHHRLSTNSIAWWEHDIEDWLRNRREP
jgi:predicted DNA-binding transcriptional regulator AlpA